MAREAAEKVFHHLLKDSNGVYFAIVTQDEKRVIGYVFLARILRSHRVARELGIVIGDKSQWNQGFGSEATRLILEYGFHQLKLHRIQLIVLESNERAIHVYRKLGFVEEGIQREARCVSGTWQNVVMMSLLEHEIS